MLIPDLASLMSPLDAASPAGDNLEYEPEFLELERLASPVAERVIGDSVKEAREPDWHRVGAQALAILQRSKDLRVVVYLTCALSRIQGLAGWTTGLALLRGLLEEYWDEVHPRLDVDDDNDPTARANAVAAIADVGAALGYFRGLPLITSPRLGSFGLRDLRLANGSLSAEAAPALTMADLEACCMDCPEEALVEAAALVGRADEHALAINHVLGERLGIAAPELAALLDDGRELRTFLDAQLARRRPSTRPLDGLVSDVTAAATTEGGRGQIESPQDVSRALERICAYYARIEPSSPVPLLLRRAQRLVGMNFIDLLRDLAPGGLGELQVVTGEHGEED